MIRTFNQLTDRFSLRFLLCAAGFLCLFASSPALAQSAFDDPGSRTNNASGGDLVAVQSAVDAGAVALGSSSQIVILLRNDDTKPLTIGDISLYPSSNVSADVSENQCAAEPLAPQAVCALALSVKGLQSGRFRIEMLVRHNGRARLLTTSVSGTVDSAGNDAGARNNDLEFSPDKVDFGSLKASRTQVRSVMLRNITSQPIEIKDIAIQSGSHAGYAIDDECTTLPSGGACVVTVKWTPQQIGPATGAILVSHTGPTGMTTIPLEGEYNPSNSSVASLFAEAVPGKGLLVSSLSEIDFGSNIEKASAITVSLVNAGDAPLTLSAMTLSNAENGMVIERAGCTPGRVLNPIEACPMTLKWTPVRQGAVLDDVTISHTGVRGVLVLPVRGSASQAVSKDSRAISLGDMASAMPRLSLSDLDEDGGQGAVARAQQDLSGYKIEDVRGVLDGYSITSLATSRAIVTGPGGSRVVSDGENAVIGGVPWNVAVRQGAVQFIHGDQSIVLLFDRSLSFINSNQSQSRSTSSTGSAPAASN